MVTTKKATTVLLWGGKDDPKIDQNRPLRAQRACPCGCDEREGPVVGYVTGSKDGTGITIMAPDEEVYQTLVTVFGERA